MAKDWYKSGSWNAICDVCGFKRKAEELAKRWDGLMVCAPSIKKGCYETRHPQEFIRVPKGERKLPWTRPEQPDEFINPFGTGETCSIATSQGSADIGIADCALADYNLGITDQIGVLPDPWPL